MTYSMIVGKYKLIFSDTHFKDFRKKPTISVYDADTNSETKIASFNSQETFEWFVEAVVKADRKTENSSEKPNNCETCRWWDGKRCHGIGRQCNYEPMIRCPKCGRSDYIREFGKDFSVTAEEAGFKYKCINCNTYIEPQTERSSE